MRVSNSYDCNNVLLNDTVSNKLGCVASEFSTLWNGMIAPLLQTTIKGAVWVRSASTTLSFDC